MASTTDSRGKTTTYTYDTARGLQTAVTDPNGNTTSYAYNAYNDRLNSVSSGNSTVGYTYNTVGALTGITSPSATQYAFHYDQFGRTTSIEAGNRTLSTTAYRDNTSSLISTFTYGNGQTVEYSYDSLDRLTQKRYNGTHR